MSIPVRILLGFGVSVLLMVLLGITALNEIDEVRGFTADVVSRDIAAIREIWAVNDSRDDMSRLRVQAVNRFLQHAVTGHPGPGAGGDVETAISQWEHQADQTDKLLIRARTDVDGFAAAARDPRRRRTWMSIQSILGDESGALGRIRVETGQLFSAIRAGDVAAVLVNDDRLSLERVNFDRLIEQARSRLDDEVETGQAASDGVYAQGRAFVLVVLLAAVLVAIAITLLIRRSILLPLGAFSAVVDRVGEGDLSVRATEDGSEFGRLGRTLNRMVKGLRQITGESRDAMENLNVSVAEIRASTQQQAAGVEEQLAAVQQTAATVDEIAHSGTQITRRAQEVMASAQATTLASASGLHAVQETGRAMEQIGAQGEAVAANIVALSEKTQAIGEIVSTVNDISERSHLLALNAAIQAAAAGEHGRSFAVVAQEMKVLADQAKEATAQVRSILGEVQRGINTSVMLTEEAVKRGAAGRDRTEAAEATIEEMAAGIQDAVQTFQQIVASTNQQQIGIEQVMVALQNIRQASQQTAAGTRQLDAAALGLGELSRRMLGVAERFRL